MKKCFVLILSLLLLVQKGFAQDGAALGFTRTERNPVTSAMAGAGAAWSQDAAFAAFSHAAMLPFFDGALDAMVSFQSWTPALSAQAHFSAGVAYKPIANLGVAIGYSLENLSSYDVVDGTGNVLGLFYPKNHIIAMGLGYGFSTHLSVGANFRYARQIPAPGAVSAGVSADLFAAWQFFPGLRATAGVSTLGPALVSGGISYKQPASAQAGVNWSTPLGQNHVLDLLLDADYYFAGAFSAALGAQYAWNRMLFARVGYRYATKHCVIPSHLALGAGVRYRGFRLDASLLTASPALGGSFNVGIGYSF